MATQDDSQPGAPTGNPYLDSLIWGCRWTGGPITYFFASGPDPDSTGFGLTWSDGEKAAFRDALQLYENVANITFQEAPSYASADIAWWRMNSFFFDDPRILGQHEVPDGFDEDPIPGHFNVDDPTWSNLSQGSFGFITIIHELGHALGLAHPHDGGIEGDATTFPGVPFGRDDRLGTFALNQGIWTTMTYNDGWNLALPPQGELGYGFQGMPMAFDIAALQAIYGANTTYNNKETSYLLPSINGSGTFWSCIWDAGGADLITASGIDAASTIDLNDAPLTGANAGGFVSRVTGIIGGFTIANGAIIENATGGNGNDTLIGNEVANILDGGLGTDNMQGGAGDDIYDVNVTGDVITELLNAGTDTVKSDADYTLAANIENLILLGAAVSGAGNTLANELTGTNFDNTLDGKSGADTMIGGAGSDLYFIDSTGDQVIDTAGGNDEVRSAVSLKAISGIERYTFTGTTAVTLAASDDAETIAGTAAADTFDGAGGNDSIDGAGGNDSLTGGGGVDTLKGGAGNDTYVVDVAGDLTDETGGSGIDQVLSGVTRTLDPTIENLTLTGAGDSDGTGNALANSITGNTSANELFGLALNDTLTGNAGADTLDGGTGSDRMAGGTEDDTYVVDLVTDIVTELAGGGKDTVRSSVTLTLGQEVENLELIEGSAALNATGNTLANSLVGNSLDNILDGKTGIDSMRGGAGDDTYIVDNIDEALASKGALVELAGGGTDTVKTSVTIDFDLAAEVENLILTGTAIVGLGNASNNTITGTSGINLLNGRGGNDSLSAGAGNDTLAGEVGNDTMDGGAGIDEFNPSAGDDTYIVDNVGDKIHPVFDDGTDTVESTITFTLVNQENLTLKGAGAINGTGNENGNLLVGNAAANILDGKGGIDELIGAAGNDTYVVDATADKVTEAFNQGIDLVKSSANYTLLDNVENLTLVIDAGNIDGTGNALNNVITGNKYDNLLTGGAGNDTINGDPPPGTDTQVGDDTLDGGTGNDAMAGGLGDDLYFVDAAGDRVTETSVLGGQDRVKSTQSYTLGTNVEELELLDDLANDINGTGNTLDNLLIGNFKNNVLDGRTGADTMQGKQGDDTYVIDNVKDVADETGGFAGTDTVKTPFTTDLASSVNLIGTFENLTLTGTAATDGTGTGDFNVIAGNGGANKLSGLGGNDTITGGAGNDSLDGGADADSLDGGTGADVMEGGLGDDIFVVDSLTDKITDSDGKDTIRSTIVYSLAALLDIENLTLLGTGALNATGNGGDNFVTGNDGANVLDGGAGADTMQGNKGNDTFKVGAGDVAMDVAGGGVDTVLSDVGYELTDPNIENLTLNAAAGAASAFGNALANKLTGNDQNNQLDGKAGADTLVGGKGNDTYFVDDAKDVITELAGVDSDNVQSTAASYTLSANVEQLTLVLGAGSINGTGNTLNNVLTGNEGNNSLAGSSGNDVLFGNGGGDTLDGGTGNDTLEGGEGDDLYVIDSAGDNFTENGSTLGDELKTNQALSVEALNIEHYTFTGSKAVNFVALGADNRITGTTLADTIDGGGGDNTLSGGAGADRLTADVGDDTYVVDNAGDKLTDSGGTNLVQSSVSFDLTDDTLNPAGTVFGTFQNLTLTGAGAVSATGNLLGNILTGNSGANVITGGQGNDTIDGGAGNDTIRYTTKLDGTDVINNFDGNVTGGQDVLNLDALFDLLSVTAPNRVARVDLVDKGSSVEVRVDTDGDLAFDLFIATINTADDITVGPDIVVGT